MSEAQRQALEKEVDVKTSQLIEVSNSLEKAEAKLREQRLQEQIDVLNKKVTTLTGAITDMEMKISNSTQDDKYALTKAKLIRLMKDLGYYE
tara:strand:+ start:366 stop:641 length:276 start_codon:yes stop_codon:yes gene_type:complete